MASRCSRLGARSVKGKSYVERIEFEARGCPVAGAVRLVLGVAAGAGAVLWLWKSGAPAAPMNAATAAAPSGGPCNGKPAKLYRNPMGSPDTSPVPKKDSMGMDYIPVCEDTGESQDDAIVKVSLDRVAALGRA